MASPPPPSALPSLPTGFEKTRKGLHAVAEKIVAPARKPENEIALGVTPGGFGTPEFDWERETHQVRVEGVDLVHRAGPNERRAPIESLASAAVVVEGLLPEPVSDDSSLSLDTAAADALAAWYAFGERVLEALAYEAGPDGEATVPTLWPEHFDVAIESGSEAAGERANYGFSPGDADHAEPYLYVGPWNQDVSGEAWNAEGFTGAEVRYSELRAAEDPLTAALDFCRRRRAALESAEGTP